MTEEIQIDPLSIEWWPIDRPKPYGKNPRRHPASQIEKLAAGIREFGWRQAIVVDSKDEIVIGHGRLEAAKLLKLSKVPVHVANDLTAAQIRALRIADNKSQEESSWDTKLLDLELVELATEDLDMLTFTGFSEEEIRDLHGSVTPKPTPSPPGAAPEEAKVDDTELSSDKLLEKWGTQIGQVWTIPSASNPKVQHRLLVGDALIEPERLLDGASLDGVCSDPWEIPARTIAQALIILGAETAILLMEDTQAFEFSSYWSFRTALVWLHKAVGGSKKLPLRSHTLVPVFTRIPDTDLNYARPVPEFTSLFGGPQDQLTVAKPVEIFRIMLSGFNWRTVADPFANNGSSLIACEATTRQWFGAAEPGNAAVILERAKLAGLEPLLTEKTAEPAKRGRGRPRKQRQEQAEE